MEKRELEDSVVRDKEKQVDYDKQAEKGENEAEKKENEALAVDCMLFEKEHMQVEKDQIVIGKQEEKNEDYDAEG